MAEILLWLWVVAVESVLEELGPDISRVWWISVGPLVNAPFHAAGDYSRGSTCNTISSVISSYIPTIKALMYATEKKLDLNQNCSVLLVTMPTTLQPRPPSTQMAFSRLIQPLLKHGSHCKTRSVRRMISAMQ